MIHHSQKAVIVLITTIVTVNNLHLVQKEDGVFNRGNDLLPFDDSRSFDSLLLELVLTSTQEHKDVKPLVIFADNVT